MGLLKSFYFAAFIILIICQFAFTEEMIDTTSNFKLIVNRKYETSFEKGLITFTEESDAVKKYMNKLKKIRDKKAKQMAESGHQPITNTEQPKIVKDKMVSEFINMIRAFQKGDFTTIDPLKLSSAIFSYSADITPFKKRIVLLKNRKKTVLNGFVVNYNLSWKHTCEGDCRLDYSEKRLAVFDSKGLLVSIETENESSF
ncbi:MAG: hypothetical protein JNL74_18045 [Fibrobacteres bacterium]|nr:hypothetical protein [Fibrobacterota bacterium]